MLVRERTAADHDAVAAFLAGNHSSRVARLGTICVPLDYPELLAVDDGGSLAGVLTYIVDGTACEILTLHTARQWRGAGTALVAAVQRVAAQAGCRRLWLVTTNDNVDALRFYQRRGFRLTALRPDAVTEVRQSLKPEIPLTGAHGIPIRDELELSMAL
jgi:ribosomal protein S18 acetylase RimI-like enzyme